MAIQTVTLNEGDSYFIPKGATILSIADPDSIGLNSPSGCIDTDVPAKKCIEFNFSLEDVDADNFDPTDGGIIEFIVINNINYPVNFMLMNAGGTSIFTANTGLLDIVPGISDSQLTSTNTSSTRTYLLTAKVPMSFIPTMMMKISFQTSRWPQGLYVKPLEVTCDIV